MLKTLGIIFTCIIFVTVIGFAAYEIWATPPEQAASAPIVQATTEVAEISTPPLSTEETALPLASEAPTAEATDESTMRRSNTYTILIVGKDKVGMNTDTIMVAMLDTDEGVLNVVSIPRDTLVNVSWDVKKVNSIYGATGTEEGLVDGISNLIGFKVDNYVVVSINAFRDIVDAIGGVYFDVPVNMNYEAPDQDLYIHVSAGYQLLNGEDAEGVVRFRSGYPNGDLGRIATQQSFAKALVKQMLSLGNIPNLSKVIDIIVENLKTDLTSGNLAFYAQEFLKLSSDDINFYTMPYDSVSINGGSYVSIRISEWLEMVNTYLNPFNVEITEDNLNVLTYNGYSFYSTTGTVSGGTNSFYDFSTE